VPLTQTLLSLAFAFMLVLCRCGAAVMLLPALGETDPPVMVRAGLALGIAVLLVPVVAPGLPKEPADFLALAGLIAGEILAGGLLGWLARLIALALSASGQVISLMIGQSSVLQPDPVLGAQTAIIGRLLNLVAPVVILTSGLYALPLRALAASYGVLPAGSIWPAGDIAEIAVRTVSQSFDLALRLAAPFVLTSMLWQAGLGLLARLVPQIQVYFASLPGQLLGGLLLLALLGGSIIDAWTEAMRAAFSALP
jgi:flagellar biosynthetic protein FliR